MKSRTAKDSAARLLHEMNADPRRRIHCDQSIRNTELLIEALEAARRAVCVYVGPTCDCKYGAFPGGDPEFQPKRLGDETTGCPELRAMIRELRADIEPDREPVLLAR